MISDKILKKIKSKKRGAVFCAKDFLNLGYKRNTIDQILLRLSDSGDIVKLSRGIYYFPIIKKDLGMIPPSMDLVAKTIADHDGCHVYPSGAVAVNMLGLTNQVQGKNIYWTDGRTKVRQIGKSYIYFQHTSIRPMPNTPYIVILILNGLSYLGKNRITDDIIKKCSQHLNDIDKKHLQKMSSKVTGWMANYINQIANA